MDKHTPGPWYVVGLPWDNGGCVVANADDPHCGELICTTDDRAWYDHTDEDEERWRADARLIAAAPDLLAACEAALLWLEAWSEGDESAEILRSAIAKAKGEKA